MVIEHGFLHYFVNWQRAVNKRKMVKLKERKQGGGPWGTFGSERVPRGGQVGQRWPTCPPKATELKIVTITKC